MEIAEKTKERSTVILAVLTLVVIGLTVLVSTQQTFRHQREAEEQHLFLTSRAVFLSIESSVKRGPVREGENRLSPRTADFFQALEQDGDVLFVGIIDEQGGKLLASPLHGDSPVDLPESMVSELLSEGEWHGRLSLEHRAAYVYGKRLEPLRGMHMSLRDDLGPPGFLVVGIDMDKHLSAYAGFRQNVIFQALYILAAALLTWGLGLSFLARRKQAQKAVALELFQAKLLDNLPDGLITVGPDGIIHSANPAALRILKRDSKEVLGQPAAHLPAGLKACTAASFEALINTPLPQRDWKVIAYEGAHLEVLALPLTNDPENACLLIIRDRTQLRNLEKSLAHAEKLAAVGTLAAGVAHEVRNPLSSLRGFAQYFVKKLAGRAPEEEYAKTMVREADRLNRVITDLLFLGRPKPISPKRIYIDALMREITTLLRFDLEQKGVGIETDWRVPEIYADEDALKQALLNLVLNSLQALQKIPGTGAVQIPLLPSGKKSAPDASVPETSREGKTETATEGPAEAGTGTEPVFPDLPDSSQRPAVLVVSGHSAGFDWIDVRDKGCGMNEEQRKLAFEAFYTDKESGTGLGLALVQRAMLDHGGAAYIASEPGRGCTVRLVFPPPTADADSAGYPSPGRDTGTEQA